jgi:formylglycine-generating enzyme required for sulfatase activity
MDPSLQSLLDCLEHISGQFHELRDGVQEAIKIADISPEMAVTRARKVLEYVIRDVYERRINEPPGTRPLENLLQRLVKDGFFPDRLDAYATTIRKLGNVGVHNFAERVEITDVYQALAQLMPILEWYFEVERPEALDGQPVHPQPPPITENRFSDRPSTASPHLAVVPKGLRSFDAHDADFFLDLLPGPRDKDGLPESIRFWKHRIETGDEATFTVGVICGPSGCGKSSLVKAGLLPRLSSRVLTVYVEATADETEARLLKGLRKQCPALSADLGFVETLSALRRGQDMPAGKKVVIVLDQFEQWLHAKREEQNTALAQALRQCDGEYVQCLVLVRDDFWLALSRFMSDLHIELVQGQNIALVDLFDLLHARHVLAAFGRAFGRLTDPPSKEQEPFLGQAIQDLAQDGRVISVRLALFAEMFKGRPWTPATLRAVGGTAGVGVSFLEETFSSAVANPKNRLHQNAARAVLKALLPEQGSDIKGNMRSYNDLLQTSGYADRPKDFEELLRVLDGELRLITPTDPDEAKAEETSEAARGNSYYQLTHDYLVHSLRDWLTRKQRESRRGRAELRLANRAALWSDKPENRNLPSLWEYLNIRLLTKGKTWSPIQRTVMQRAGWIHGVRSGITAAVLIALVLAGSAVSRKIEEKRQADYAASLVEQLVAADTAEVPRIVDKLAGYRRWADPLLRQEDDKAEAGSKEKLRMTLALLPVDESKVDYLRDQLLVVTPTQFPVVRDALLSRKDALVEPLWRVALDSKRRIQQRFQAACALATYAPGNDRWKQIDKFVAGHLVTLQASDLVAWREALRGAKSQLIGPLAAIYRNSSDEQLRQSRVYATETLADYAAARPEVLVDLLADAEQFQFPVIFSKLAAHQTQAISQAESELAKRADEKASEDDKERHAKRQANLAMALLRMGNTDDVWPLLKFSRDPRARSFLIHSIAPLGGDPQTIIRRLEAELDDVTTRRALVLSLGEFSDTELPAAQRQPLIQKLLSVYENEPDAGLHGAAEWLLRKWGQTREMQAVLEKLWSKEEQLQASKATDKRQWYFNTQGQTFVILNAGEFQMGSPASEPGRSDGETQHLCRIGRRFAIATTNVTKAQFAKFQTARPEIPKMDTAKYVTTDDSPQISVTWYEAAQYCNWLSQQEGIDEKQWCYEPNEKGEYRSGMKAKDKYLELSGYRLPTEAECEYACRAGTTTSRYYGLSETLLPKYAWYLTNGEDRTWPVGSLKPNDFGLFDMHGNGWDWCNDAYESYPKAADDISKDLGSTKPIVDTVRRVMRGGSAVDPASAVRSACRFSFAPLIRVNNFGFRAVRTYP